MGLRGPLATKHSKPAKALSDLSPPTWLGELGKEHWTKHAPYMTDEGLLTTQTADSFGIVCDLYQKYRTGETHRERMDCLKGYQVLAKYFRLVPVDGPGKPQERHEDKRGFTFA